MLDWHLHWCFREVDTFALNLNVCLIWILVHSPSFRFLFNSHFWLTVYNLGCLFGLFRFSDIFRFLCYGFGYHFFWFLGGDRFKNPLFYYFYWYRISLTFKFHLIIDIFAFNFKQLISTYLFLGSNFKLLRISMDTRRSFQIIIRIPSRLLFSFFLIWWFEFRFNMKRGLNGWCWYSWRIFRPL